MIEINDLRFKYPMRVSLFNEMKLSIEAGHITGLLGKNGEGKTTLLKLIAGQLLRMGGYMNIMGEDPGDRRVSFLSDVYYLPEVISVPRACTIRNYFKAIREFYPNFSQDIADEAMREFEIEYDMRLDKISQGQQKKAAIALALSLGTRLLLLDEPTNGLDIPAKSVFRRLLAKYITDDRTVIISTHQVRDLEQIIDHLVVMSNNRIILSDSITAIAEHFTFRSVLKGEEPLYEEMTPTGRVGVFAKEEGDVDTAFSTELFFNALMGHREEVMKVLRQS